MWGEGAQFLHLACQVGRLAHFPPGSYATAYDAVMERHLRPRCLPFERAGGQWARSTASLITNHYYLCTFWFFSSHGGRALFPLLSFGDLAHRGLRRLHGPPQEEADGQILATKRFGLWQWWQWWRHPFCLQSIRQRWPNILTVDRLATGGPDTVQFTWQTEANAVALLSTVGNVVFEKICKVFGGPDQTGRGATCGPRAVVWPPLA